MFEPGLSGVRVALLEARMGSELAELVRRRGGVPTCAPAVKEVAIDSARAVASFVQRREGRVVIFLTGAGASALFREAERQERLCALVDVLGRDRIVCRGPKPSAVIRRYGLSPGPSVPEPYTSAALFQALAPIDLAGIDVTLVHYGERNAELADALTGRGAVLEELCLYEWHLPDDVGPIESMIAALVAGRFDALAFTSQIQCRHLFQIASRIGMEAQLVDVLNGKVVVAAIGPTCEAAVRQFGVIPHVVPRPPKMGALVAALAAHFSSQ